MNSLLRDLLNTLLERYERPNRQRVVRVKLEPKTYPLYYSADDASIRRETNGVLQTLEARGLLRLHWERWEERNWLTKLDLVPEGAAELYSLLERTPLTAQREAVEALLNAQTPVEGWHATFLATLREQLETHRSLAPLELADPDYNRDLLSALAALATLGVPTLERLLSVRLFGDSKRLYSLRRAILTTLRRFSPDAASYGDDDDALLRAHGLERVPEYVPISGSLRLHYAGETLDTSPFRPSVALSALTLREAEVVACDARALVTVENLSSFSELVTLQPEGVIVLFTGGFASPSVIRLISALKAHTPTLRLLHWGDLDAGGFRILLHLRQQLGEVETLGMNSATYRKYERFSQGLTEGDKGGLEALLTEERLRDCAEVMRLLLERGRKLEQEAQEVAEIVAELGET